MLGSGDSSASPIGERERIRLLDLSGNELESVSCLMDRGFVQQQLEHLTRLDLSQNSLSEFPSTLCEVTPQFEQAPAKTRLQICMFIYIVLATFLWD